EARTSRGACVEMWVPSKVHGDIQIPAEYKVDTGVRRYWLWIVSIRGESHSTYPYDTLERCHRAKADWKGARLVQCLPVSPYGPGPFYIYLDDGVSFERGRGHPPFTSLDDCDV